MPFPRPVLDEIIARTEQELATRLGIGALLRRSILGALARALAGASHLLHGHLDWLARQLFPDTADGEHLARWAGVWNVTRKPASAFECTLRFSGTSGAVVPDGTRLQRDDGTEYETDGDATLAGGTADAKAAALEVGSGPNVAPGAFLSLVSPVSGVQAAAEVLEDALADGADVETDEDLRARVLDRIQSPPHGGAAWDYTAWALEVPGVTRAWAFPLHLGPGSVGVTCATDDAPGGPIPDAGKVAEVQAYIDLRRPVTAAVTVYPPLERAISMQIELEPDSLAVRAAVQASLEDLLRREAVPGATLLVSHVREAISTTPGEFDHVLELLEGEAPADIEIDPSELGTLGAIAWA